MNLFGFLLSVALICASLAPCAVIAAEASPAPSAKRSYTATTVRIPMRDGVELVGDLVLPGDGKAAPLVVAITPYGRHALHVVAAQYVQAGMAFLSLDTRGRGDSGGQARAFYSDVTDTCDALAWAGGRSWANGRIAMWGASYGGYNQWMAASKCPARLTTITPSAAVFPGRDFPMIGNVGYPYMATWTGFTLGRMSAFPLFNDQLYWREAFGAAMAAGTPFRDFDKAVGFDSDQFDEWVQHPHPDAYWDAINPTDAEIAAIDMPVLTITGLYDGAQLGALSYYRKHIALAKPAAREKHYLVIGPYDHAGVTFPGLTVAGLPVPDRGGMNPVLLAREWFAWTMAAQPRPAFLRDRVMIYVMGENAWRSAPSLDAIVSPRVAFSLASGRGATATARAGGLELGTVEPGEAAYRYDPRDLSKADLGVWFEGPFALHDADVKAIYGDGLVFETAPFAKQMDVIGTPRFEADIAVDTPDTDFRLRLYEVRADGSSVYLSEQRFRARYRVSPRDPQPLTTKAFQRYVFDDFAFVARRLDRGSRLRFVFDPPNSIYVQRNYNAALPVADQTPADALVATVRVKLGGRSGARLSIPLVEAPSR